MNKIQCLDTIKQYVEQSRNTFVRHVHTLLLSPDPTPEDLRAYNGNLMIVGQATVLLDELDQHSHCLAAIILACEHGLAGTVPPGHDAWTAEFGPFVNSLPAPYDPYQEILAYLTGGAYLPCLALSPSLLAFIDMMPEQAGKRFERELFEHDGVLTHVDGDGNLRPAADTDIQRLGDQAVLQAMEHSFFATTYAADMAQVKQLAEQRADFHQILALL